MKSYRELNNEQEYFDNPDTFTEERYQQFFQHLPIHAVTTVLDVGCNTGYGGRVLKNLNPNLKILGMDCVPSFLSSIPEGVYTEKILAQSIDIPLQESSIDVVVAGEFIEHLYPNDAYKILREFHRVIKGGGRLLLTTPNPNYLILKLRNQSVIGGPHVSEHYPQQLKGQLMKLGFSNIQFFGSGKVSRLLGEKFPLLFLYGSYLVTADKVSKTYSTAVS